MLIHQKLRLILLQACQNAKKKERTATEGHHPDCNNNLTGKAALKEGNQHNKDCLPQTASKKQRPGGNSSTEPQCTGLAKAENRPGGDTNPKNFIAPASKGKRRGGGEGNGRARHRETAEADPVAAGQGGTTPRRDQPDRNRL
ncbi:hypothetical protein Nepgr_023212 [Nepenthes gracilis]|uniref:Uncharacterized protein n=1 Tax=Nepenthes gracilis TaxID=150966 RepID=A0AAD3T209_NEPGR|nr:hypothetical protein Nepgr_023212 [Nepenthes gracilis]